MKEKLVNTKDDGGILRRKSFHRSIHCGVSFKFLLYYSSVHIYPIQRHVVILFFFIVIPRESWKNSLELGIPLSVILVINTSSHCFCTSFQLIQLCYNSGAKKLNNIRTRVPHLKLLKTNNSHRYQRQCKCEFKAWDFHNSRGIIIRRRSG